VKRPVNSAPGRRMNIGAVGIPGEESWRGKETMNVQPKRVQVLCPSCNRTYDVTITPPVSSAPEVASGDCHTECCIVTCPACQHEIPCNVTFVKDAVFQVQCDKRRN